MGRLSNGILCVLVAMGGMEACGRPTTVLDTCAKISNVEQAEGNPVPGASGTQPVQFTVTFTGCTAEGTFSYGAIADNATSGTDFVPLTGSMRFGRGNTPPQSITLEVKLDDVIEDNERVWIGGCLNKKVVNRNDFGLDAAGMLTIVDDDSPATAMIAKISGTPPPPTTIPDGYGCGR